ncbi:MAG: hypothetical protein QE267_10360 [Akkermansiaceae bacterium]|nr:hypothetical protein [Akkermansiaceae bacterium]
MPSPEREPESYSFDEMMDRLKRHSSAGADDGKLITRIDGSEALRVRKRKRRTKQPEKEQRIKTRRNRIIQLSAIMAIILVLILGGGIAMVYVNGTSFRKDLITKISTSTGASVDLRQFRMNPKTANAGQVSLDWPDGNMLKNLTMYGVSAEVFPSSFFGDTMVGDELTSPSGILALQIPTLGQPTRNTQSSATEIPIQFKCYRISKLDLTIGPIQNPMLRLSKSECSLYPSSSSIPTQLRMNQGELAIPGYPKLHLERALIELQGDNAQIIGMRLSQSADKSGSFDLSGAVSPYEPEHLSTLAVELRSLEISALGFPSLTTFVNGRVDSLPSAISNTLSFLPTATPKVTLEVAFQSSADSAITLQGLPFLSNLSTVLKGTWFKQPKFNAKAQGVLLRENNSVTLRELDLESKGRMALTGTISIAEDQTLSGDLQIGIPEVLIDESKSLRLKATFGQARGGYCWVTVTLGGSVRAPKDNFKDLFSDAVIAPLDQPMPGGSQGSTFEELTRPK